MLQPILLQALLLAPGPAPAPLVGDEWVIQSGTTARYDTSLGRLFLERLRIEAGGTLRVVGPDPFVLIASKSVEIEGLLDLSGSDSIGVTTLNTTNQPEPGAAGGPGGGEGGTASRLTDASTPSGDPGMDERSALLGGGGGETSYAPTGKNDRRGAGGGGGSFGADQPVNGNPNDPVNWGLEVQPGRDGGPGGLGAISQTVRAAGGPAGRTVFSDPDPANDFWGVRVDASGTTTGELAGPLGGRGGGGGGDAVDSASFPLLPFSPTGDEKGAGGGGGGGVGLVLARTIVVGPAGRIRANGGAGGGGENTNFFDRVGGGSGAGSGGMLVLEARTIDLSAAAGEALSARGGIGGVGRDNKRGTVGAGGDGGPGLIQLHLADPAKLVLPGGVTLDDLSAPNAYVLRPVLGQ